MTPSQRRKEFELILKTSTAKCRRANKYWSHIHEVRKSTIRIIVKALRQVIKQEYEIKKMRWKREATRKWNWNNYHINKLGENKYWLGKTPYGWTTPIGIGIFTDMETAKYVVYLIK